MKKIFLAIAIAVLMSITASAQNSKRVVTDSVTFMPDKVQIFNGVTKNGNPKYWIELPTETGMKKVTISESHATSGRLLALIERKDIETGRFYYSVKFAVPRRKAGNTGKADLSGLK